MSLTARAGWIFAATSLFFGFVTAATFTSLGVVLFTMATELHWSQTAAGFSFSLLGLSCGLSCPLPAVMMKHIGSRWTMVCGAVVLTVGFALAAMAQSIQVFWIATALMGIGFTLVANIPGIYLLATWFPQDSARIIGFYFMAGAFGGVFGPPLVEAVIEITGSWRAYWALTAVAAAAIGLGACFAIKDVAPIQSSSEVTHARSRPSSDDPAATDWAPREAMLTRQFMVIALAMLVIQTALTTLHGMLVTHLASLGSTRAFGAYTMSIFALTGAITKGIAGTITRYIPPLHQLIWGTALQALALVLVGFATSHAIAIAFAVLFGIGWGASWLAAHVLLLNYFGRKSAAIMVSTATLMTTAAVVGPVIAGIMADKSGTFSAFFYVMAALMAVAGLACVGMRAPQPQSPATLPESAAQRSMSV